MISAWECFHFATLELVRSTPIKQRLICAYPAEAVLRPGADADQAASYTCRATKVAGRVEAADHPDP